MNTFRLKTTIMQPVFIIFAYLTFTLSNVHASTNEINTIIKIGSYYTPGLIEENGSGLFNQLNRAIFQELNQEMKLSLSSIKRARLGITTNQLDAYFPELWENLPGSRKNYIISDPIFYKRIILFSLKNANIHTLADLHGGLIGAVKGFSYGEAIKSNNQLNLSYQDNDFTNIKLLLNNRINAVIGGYPSTVMAVKSHDKHHIIHYDLNKPVAVLESFYVCKNDPAGVKLCNAINNALNSLKNKGILTLNAQTGFSQFTPK